MNESQKYKNIIWKWTALNCCPLGTLKFVHFCLFWIDLVSKTLKINDLPSLPPARNIRWGWPYPRVTIRWTLEPNCVSTEAVADVSYSRITRNLNTPSQSGLFTRAGLRSIFCRVTVSLSDGCESDSSSPSPPADNKAPSSLRAAHNQVSWSCDAIEYLVHQPTTMETSYPQGFFFTVIVSLFGWIILV